MLRPRAGDSHDSQADVTPPGISLPGLFEIRHCWHNLAALPRSDVTMEQGFGKRFLYKYGFAQVSFGFHKTTSLFKTKLASHDGSRHPFGARENSKRSL